MVKYIDNILATFAETIWGTPLLVLLLGGGIIFTLYCRFIPFRYIQHGINILRGQYDDPNDPGTPVGNLPPADEGYTEVEHGFLEQSNSTSLSEMTNLIRSLRHFEANQQVIRSLDQRLGQAIQALTNTQ